MANSGFRKGGYRRKRPRARESVVCPQCGKLIRDMYSAIACHDTQTPAHFECVLKHLKRASNLGPNEKMCYLGGGSFGVIQNRSPQSPMRFLIRKRIQYEDQDETPEWRQRLSYKMHRPRSAAR